MESPEQQLPILKIEDSDFFVDVNNLQLIDCSNKTNTIHLSDMESVGNHYQFLFDKTSKNIPSKITSNYKNNLKQVVISIRNLEFYDPKRAEEIYNNRGFKLEKNLPIINIEGTEFLWERRTALLHEKDNYWNTISSQDFNQTFKGKIGCLFNAVEKTVLLPYDLYQIVLKGQTPSHIHFVKENDVAKKILAAEEKFKSKIPQQIKPKLKLR